MGGKRKGLGDLLAEAYVSTLSSSEQTARMIDRMDEVSAQALEKPRKPDRADASKFPTEQHAKHPSRYSKKQGEADHQANYSNYSGDFYPVFDHDKTDHPLNYPEDAAQDYAESVTPDGLWAGLSPNQTAVLRLLLRLPPTDIVQYARIAEEIGIPVNTVKTIFRRLKALGAISTRFVRRGMLQGMTLIVNERLCGPPPRPLHDGDRAPEAAATLRALDPGHLREQWPHLADRGLTPAVLTRICNRLAAVGRSTANLRIGLDHAEWEAANAPPSPPLERVLGVLTATGYYPRPRNYVSHEEQAALDAQATARTALEARRRVEELEADHAPQDESKGGRDLAVPDGDRDEHDGL